MGSKGESSKKYRARPFSKDVWGGGRKKALWVDNYTWSGRPHRWRLARREEARGGGISERRARKKGALQHQLVRNGEIVLSEKESLHSEPKKKNINKKGKGGERGEDENMKSLVVDSWCRRRRGPVINKSSKRLPPSKREK